MQKILLSMSSNRVSKEISLMQEKLIFLLESYICLQVMLFIKNLLIDRLILFYVNKTTLLIPFYYSIDSIRVRFLIYN